MNLELYDHQSLEKIIKRSAGISKVDIDESGTKEIALRSRGTPRIANRLLKRVRDYAQVVYDGKINEEISKEGLNLLEVDSLGLDCVDRKILLNMINNFNGGPVGVETIAASTGEERVTIEDVYEPYLLQIGFLNRTPRGRKVTEKAYKHLNMEYKRERE